MVDWIGEETLECSALSDTAARTENEPPLLGALWDSPGPTIVPAIMRWDLHKCLVIAGRDWASSQFHPEALRKSIHGYTKAYARIWN